MSVSWRNNNVCHVASLHVQHTRTHTRAYVHTHAHTHTHTHKHARTLARTHGHTQYSSVFWVVFFFNRKRASKEELQYCFNGPLMPQNDGVSRVYFNVDANFIARPYRDELSEPLRAVGRVIRPSSHLIRNLRVKVEQSHVKHRLQNPPDPQEISVLFSM